MQLRSDWIYCMRCERCYTLQEARIKGWQANARRLVPRSTLLISSLRCPYRSLRSQVSPEWSDLV